SPCGRSRNDRRGTAPFLFDRDVDRGAFGDVAGARLDTADRVEAEAVAETVEQRSNAVSGRFRAAAREIGLLRFEFLGGEDGKDHVLDAEAGIDRLELCDEQFCEMARIAARPRGAEADVLDMAVDAVKAERKAARSHTLARKARRQILGEAFDRAG